MCCAEFVVKYVLIIANLLFAVLGLAVVGLGAAIFVNLRDLNEILPVNFVPITLIALGCVVFLIGFLACCGAIRESRCMLISYAIFLSLLAALFIWMEVVIFGALDSIEDTVDGWIVSAFDNENLRPAFNVLEATFSCCGTIGAESYFNQTLPVTCCPEPRAARACAAAQAYQGCGDMVGSWFQTIGEAVGGVLIVVIIVEIVAVIFASFFSRSISNKARRAQY